MRQYRDWIIGIVVYFVAFAAVLALTGSAVAGLGLGVVFGAAAGLLVHGLAPADEELVQYRLDVRRRVRTVLKTSDAIRDLAGKVHDEPSRQALIKGCDVIRDLLSLAQRKDPDNMATTAAKVGVYLTSVKTAVDVQLQIEAHPDYWANADELLAANREGFADFRQFALTSVQHLNQGEVTELRANLRLLQPMAIPSLGG